MLCIRCKETSGDEGPWYDAEKYADELEMEKIRYDPSDQLCQPCACQYEERREALIDEAYGRGTYATNAS